MVHTWVGEKFITKAILFTGDLERKQSTTEVGKIDKWINK